MDLAVVGANLRIYVGARMDARSGDFPLYRYDLPNVCVPLGSAPGAVAPAAPPAPNVTVVQGGGGDGKDQDARNQAKSAAAQASEALGQVGALSARLGAIEGGQLSEATIHAITDVLWNTPAFKDRLYSWLKERDPGLTEQIAAIAREAVQPALAAPSA